MLMRTQTNFALPGLVNRFQPPRVSDLNSTGHKSLLLGLGNDLLSDDAIGLRVVRELRLRAAELQDFDFVETTEMGLALLDICIGFDQLVMVDAIQTGTAPPGSIHLLSAEHLKPVSRSPHGVGIGELIAFGRQLGQVVPTQVRIIAIEVVDPFTVSTSMTPALEQALPRIVNQVRLYCWQLSCR